MYQQHFLNKTERVPKALALIGGGIAEALLDNFPLVLVLSRTEKPTAGGGTTDRAEPIPKSSATLYCTRLFLRQEGDDDDSYILFSCIYGVLSETLRTEP
jgi:hypothetical protein